jgi:ribonuclease P protein component
VDRKAREGFPKRHRIMRGSEYRVIYNTGRKLQSERFVLFCRENDLPHHRLGITVTRKVGSSVVRNRIKRLFREVFRRSSGEIPNHYDLVFNAKSTCASANYWELREEFLAAMHRFCTPPA